MKKTIYQKPEADCCSIGTGHSILSGSNTVSGNWDGMLDGTINGSTIYGDELE